MLAPDGVQRGAVVTDVLDGSPAAKSGLRPGRKTASAFGVDFPRSGDVIVSINGRRVAGSEDIARIVTSLRPSQVARLTVERGDARLVLPVRLGERSEGANGLAAVAVLGPELAQDARAHVALADEGGGPA